jgi:hypothetical protein
MVTSVIVTEAHKLYDMFFFLAPFLGIYRSQDMRERMRESHCLKKVLKDSTLALKPETFMRNNELCQAINDIDSRFHKTSKITSSLID